MDNIQVSLTTEAGSIELMPPAWVVKIELSEAASLIVSENIRAEMARKRVTGEHLATILGKSQSVTSKRLRGVVVWDIDELVIVAQALDVELSVLLAGLELLTGVLS